MLQFVKLKGKDYPVNFGNGALIEWAHHVGSELGMLLERLEELNSYESAWLFYMGLKHGSIESRGRPIKMTYGEFVDWADEDTLMALGGAFQEELFVRLAAQGVDVEAIKNEMDAKKKEVAEASTSGSTTESAQAD